MIHNGKYSKFRSFRIENGIQKFKIVDICGEIINDNPTEEELIALKQYVRFSKRDVIKWPDADRREYLLEFMKQFYRNEGRIPNARDFQNNPKYPSIDTYIKLFRKWNNAIKEAGLVPHHAGQQTGIYTYTDEELLEYQIKWYEEYGEPPTSRDFMYNLKYPNFSTYDRLGGWQPSLKILGLDIDSLVRRGIIKTKQQKGRLGVILVVDYYKDIIGMKDITEKDYNSPYDVISSEGTGDVKTSEFCTAYWQFHFLNVDIYEIDWFYLLAFNENYRKLLYAWKVPIDKLHIEDAVIIIGLNIAYKCNVENMNKYEITDKIQPIFEKWLEDIKNQDNSKETIVRDARERLRKYVDKNKRL